MKSTQLVAAVLAVLVVGAGAVAATPAASTSGQTAADALPGDDHAANESEAEPGANAPVDVPANGANDRSLPEQASDTAKTVQSTIADWFGANESEREHDSLGDAISTAVGDDDADAGANASVDADAEADADDDADESADDRADASADAGANASADAGANASATGQAQASEHANDDGVVHAVVSFLTGGDADA